MRLSILFLLLLSCSQKKIILIKQWHLSPQTPTSNISQAKELPQFENQKDIFLFLKERIDQVDVLIAEGCEGELDQDRSEKFNSWSLVDLMQRKDAAEFEDIMAPVPMKIKALFPRKQVVCGDDIALIKKNLRAASDMQGLFGFYKQLTEARQMGHLKKEQLYAERLRELYPKENIKSPIDFTRQKTLEAIEEFSVLVKKRNDKFVESILNHKAKSVAVVIGGYHVKDLEMKLKSQGRKVEVYTPQGYQDNEEQLLEKVRASLQKKIEPTVFMAPEGFQLANFPLQNRIPIKQFMSDQEYQTLKKLCQNNNIPLAIINSDFDQDGVRDFTLSTMGNKLIISAEDQDWDNDGNLNLVDETVSRAEIAKLSQKTPLMNNYKSSSDISQTIKELKKSVVLVQEEKAWHEFLVLDILNQLVAKKIAPIKNLKFLRASHLLYSRGENNFFNYVKVARTLNYDSKKLKSFFDDEYEKRFQGAKKEDFIKSYVLPVIVHSLLHELGHSLDFDFEEFAKTQGWSWQLAAVKSSYLQKSREPIKILKEVKQKLRFKKKSPKQWQTLYSQHMAKTPRENFLARHQLASLYSTHSPGEWFAEVFAICGFQKLYPKSITETESIRFEQLIGINPRAIDSQICAHF